MDTSVTVSIGKNKDVNKMVKKVSKKTPRSVNKKPIYKWDVINAEKDYLSDTTMSYKQIAEKYKINVRTVENYAKANNWVERRFELGKKGLEKFEDSQAELISKTNQEHIKMFKNARNIVYNEMIKHATIAGKNPIPIKDLNGIVFALSKAIDGERTVLGLPTEIRGVKEADGEKDMASWTDLMLAVMEADKDAGAKL